MAARPKGVTEWTEKDWSEYLHKPHTVVTVKVKRADNYGEGALFVTKPFVRIYINGRMVGRTDAYIGGDGTKATWSNATVKVDFPTSYLHEDVPEEKRKIMDGVARPDGRTPVFTLELCDESVLFDRVLGDGVIPMTALLTELSDAAVPAALAALRNEPKPARVLAVEHEVEVGAPEKHMAVSVRMEIQEDPWQYRRRDLVKRRYKAALEAARVREIRRVTQRAGEMYGIDREEVTFPGELPPGQAMFLEISMVGQRSRYQGQMSVRGPGAPEEPKNAFKQGTIAEGDFVQLNGHVKFEDNDDGGIMAATDANGTATQIPGYPVLSDVYVIHQKELVVVDDSHIYLCIQHPVLAKKRKELVDENALIGYVIKFDIHMDELGYAHTVSDDPSTW
eukprot:CAMPEP_0119142590 /NCGR_PEP_ID=MMETSP1310-20130426/32896_1 /TAXON_ID=464262 /ORGANISM="Genus nov. species nov., Strain RCC2339" /LENGTH=392 /DNA_ID=CAMNT_0007134141 /DNA_START=51 /DNA_END=1232 /DNA_ORIENTATION=-